MSLRLAIAVALLAPAAACAGSEPPRRWTAVVLHHTATDAGSVPAIDAAHRRRLDADGNPWLGIGYHFLIGNGHGMPDGAVEPTFRWDRQIAGAHAGDRDLNATAIGIALVGNFEESEPTAAQRLALTRLIEKLAIEHDIDADAVLAHRDAKPTLCPGRHFPLAEARAAIGGSLTPARGVSRGAKTLSPPSPPERPAGHLGTARHIAARAAIARTHAFPPSGPATPEESVR